jgi:cobalamin biosynthesis protein CobT
MSDPITAAVIMATTMAATTGTQTAIAHHEQKAAQEAQANAQAAAQEQQKKADQEAEQKRLEGIASNLTATDYGNIWGTESKKYADAAQKLSAGTGSFSDDDETNPFYSRGLI